MASSSPWEARVAVLLAGDQATRGDGGFRAFLSRKAARAVMEARAASGLGWTLPDLVAVDLRCATCSAGAGGGACSYCDDAKVWTLPWRGHISSENVGESVVEVSKDMADCLKIKHGAKVVVTVLEELPQTIKAVIMPLGSADLAAPLTPQHIACQVGIIYPGMTFPLSVNKVRIGSFKVIGAYPVNTGQILPSTKILINHCGEEKTIGENLLKPVFHPISAWNLKMNILNDENANEVIQTASQIIEFYKRNPNQAMKGKLTFLLDGPYEKQRVVEGIGNMLNIPVLAVNSVDLIKDFPGDSVQEINKYIKRSESSGPLLVFIDRFDDLALPNRCGSTYLTDITATQLKLLLDDPLDRDRLTIILAGVRWKTLICPALLTSIRVNFFCGTKEEEYEWDCVGRSLLDFLTTSGTGQDSAWSVTNAILYGNTGITEHVTRLFASLLAYECETIESVKLIQEYTSEPTLVPDIFMRAAGKRPCIVLISQLDAIKDPELISALCAQIDQMGRGVVVFGCSRWWQMIDKSFMRVGRLTKKIFCGIDSMEEGWNHVGKALLEDETSA